MSNESDIRHGRHCVSSRLLRQQRPDIRKRYWKGVLWSPSYFASSCGGAPISIVRQYIEQQKTPD
jgi:putative transposase